MGDRCMMRLTCFEKDRKVFEELGFVQDDDPVNGVVEMLDEEANYAHYDEMPKDVVYEGYHYEGGAYPAGMFACDGETLVWADAASGDQIQIYALVEEDGTVNEASLQRARDYLGLYKKVQQMLKGA